MSGILFKMDPETREEMENQRLQRKARKLERRATRQASKLSKMIDELSEDEALDLAELILAEALSSAEGLRKVVDVLARIEDAIESSPADEQGNIPVPAHCWVNKKTGQMADTQAHDEIVRGDEDAFEDWWLKTRWLFPDGHFSVFDVPVDVDAAFVAGNYRADNFKDEIVTAIGRDRGFH